MLVKHKGARPKACKDCGAPELVWAHDTDQDGPVCDKCNIVGPWVLVTAGFDRHECKPVKPEPREAPAMTPGEAWRERVRKVADAPVQPMAVGSVQAQLAPMVIRYGRRTLALRLGQTAAPRDWQHRRPARGGAPYTPAARASRLPLVNLNDEPERIAWLVGGVVARGYVTMIAGEPGAGKSMLTQSLAVGLANGEAQRAGLTLDPAANLVTVLDAENGKNLILERARSAGLTRPNNYRVAAVQRFDLRFNMGDLDELLVKYPTDMLVLDSFTSLWFGNENVVDQVRSVLTDLNDLAAQHDCGVLLIHHTTKGGKTYRGSSAIAATIAGTFALSKRGPVERQLSCVKMRIAQEPAPLTLYVGAGGMVGADDLARARATRRRA